MDENQNSMGEGQNELSDLADALYGKLNEAFEIAEKLEGVGRTNQELRQARRLVTRIHRLQGVVVDLRHSFEDREELEDREE